MTYYLTGTVHWLDEIAAEVIAANHPSAVARQDPDATWTVYFLQKEPRQPGQEPFALEEGEDFMRPTTWRPGYPPDDSAYKWEVCSTRGGPTWHRPRKVEPFNHIESPALRALMSDAAKFLSAELPDARKIRLDGLRRMLDNYDAAKVRDVPEERAAEFHAALRDFANSLGVKL